jgi:hypothetical protein
MPTYIADDVQELRVRVAVVGARGSMSFSTRWPEVSSISPAGNHVKHFCEKELDPLTKAAKQELARQRKETLPFMRVALALVAQGAIVAPNFHADFQRWTQSRSRSKGGGHLANSWAGRPPVLGMAPAKPVRGMDPNTTAGPNSPHGPSWPAQSS